MKLKLIIPAGKATMGPPIGPVLGQAGLNGQQFVKEFNAKTDDFQQGIPLRVKIFVDTSKKYTFEILLPRTSYFIQQVVSSKSNRSITLRELFEIARLYETSTDQMHKIMHSLIGSCRAMKIQVVKE